MLAYFRGKSLVSRLIKWRTWGEYSHVAWIEPDGTIYESWHRREKGAIRNGVRKGFAGDLHTNGTPIDLYRAEMTDEQHAAFIAEMERRCRDPKAKYAFRAVIVGFIVRKFIKDYKMFCSELMMTGMVAAKKRFLINIAPEQASPVDCSRSPQQYYVGQWLSSDAFPLIDLPEGSR